MKERDGKVGEGEFCPEGRQEVDLEVVWASAQQPVCSWCCRASDMGRMTDEEGEAYSTQLMLGNGRLVAGGPSSWLGPQCVGVSPLDTGSLPSTGEPVGMCVPVPMAAQVAFTQSMT